MRFSLSAIVLGMVLSIPAKAGGTCTEDFVKKSAKCPANQSCIVLMNHESTDPKADICFKVVTADVGDFVSAGGASGKGGEFKFIHLTDESNFGWPAGKDAQAKFRKSINTVMRPMVDMLDQLAICNKQVLHVANPPKGCDDSDPVLQVLNPKGRSPDLLGTASYGTCSNAIELRGALQDLGAKEASFRGMYTTMTAERTFTLGALVKPDNVNSGNTVSAPEDPMCGRPGSKYLVTNQKLACSFAAPAGGKGLFNDLGITGVNCTDPNGPDSCVMTSHHPSFCEQMAKMPGPKIAKGEKPTVLQPKPLVEKAADSRVRSAPAKNAAGSEVAQ